MRANSYITEMCSMNYIRMPQNAGIEIGQVSLRLIFRAGIKSAIWIIALLFTLISITFHLIWSSVTAITRLSFRCIVYMLLGTVFVCSVVLLAILSIITLGAVSLP